MPFYKEIVVASQVHKYIKRLKKALDALVEGLDPSSLEDVVHPISGGLSIGKVVTAVDELMDSWKKAAAESTSTDENLDPFQNIRKEVQSRYDDLVKFQNDGGAPPSWCQSEQVLSAVSTPVAGKTSNAFIAPHILSKPIEAVDCNKNDNETDSKQRIRQLEFELHATEKAAKEAREKRTLEELLSKKRKDKTTLLELRKPEKLQKTNQTILSSKRVSWADRPVSKDILPKPLTQERIFEKQGRDEEGAYAHDNTYSEVQIKEEDFYPWEDSELEDLCSDPV